MADIRAAMESGDISPDSARALFSAMRAQRGGGQRPAGTSEEATPGANGDDQAEAGQAGQGRLPGGQPGGRGGAGRGFGGGMMAVSYMNGPLGIRQELLPGHLREGMLANLRGEGA